MFPILSFHHFFPLFHRQLSSQPPKRDALQSRQTSTPTGAISEVHPSCPCPISRSGPITRPCTLSANCIQFGRCKSHPIFKHQKSSKLLVRSSISPAALIMLPIPPSVRRLVILFLIAAPLLSIVLPAAAAPADTDAPSKLQPRAPQPSRRMGATKRSKKMEPLKKKDYSSFLCPGGSVACPIPGDEVTPSSVEALEQSLNSLADWFKVGFECVELDTELNSCGGCLALGSGYVDFIIHSFLYSRSHNSSLIAKIVLSSKTLVQLAVRVAHAKCTHASTVISSLLTEHLASKRDLQLPLLQLPLSISKSLSPMISSL